MSGLLSFDNGVSAFVVVFVVVALLVLGTFVAVIVRGTVQWSRNNASPVESSRATVATKRTDTRGGAGDARASTAYFVTFELTDGTRLELPVRGRQYGQLADGDRGTLTRQGTRFTSFVRGG